MKKAKGTNEISDKKSSVNPNFKMSSPARSKDTTIKHLVKESEPLRIEIKKEKQKKTNTLELISDDVVDFINKYAKKHVVSEEYKKTSIF